MAPGFIYVPGKPFSAENRSLFLLQVLFNPLPCARSPCSPLKAACGCWSTGLIFVGLLLSAALLVLLFRRVIGVFDWEGGEDGGSGSLCEIAEVPLKAF